MRMPAPSPVLASQPHAPRWLRFIRTWSACWMIVWDFRPLMSATNPTPQASCSNCGSYSPCLAGGPVRGLRLLATALFLVRVIFPEIEVSTAVQNGL